MVETARSSGRPTVAHANTVKSMRSAILAGIETIEHGDDGTPEVFALMKENEVALCPPIAARDVISQYKGWKKGKDPAPTRITSKRTFFKAALKSGVTICAGGDVIVFAHGDNARELELMVEYAMTPFDVLKSSTCVSARVFLIDKEVGRILAGLKADNFVVKGDPTKNISDLRNIVWMMKRSFGS